MARHDLVVVGAGAAGLSAATRAAELGLSVMVVESTSAGGQVANVDGIENLPGTPAGTPGYELGPQWQEQAAGAGAEFMLGSVQSLAVEAGGFSVVLADEAVQARAVIVAAGSAPRTLGVPGEESLRGRGVSQCASCDGPLFRGLHAAVVGGGDAAVSEALHLATHAARVTLIHRGASLRAQPALVERLRAAETITTLLDTTVERIEGGNAVEALLLRKGGTGEQHTLACDGVFVYIGAVPNTAFLQGLLALDERGRIVTDPQGQSSLAGIFAAGDIRSGSAAMLWEAIADGAAAVTAVAAGLHSPDLSPTSS